MTPKQILQNAVEKGAIIHIAGVPLRGISVAELFKHGLFFVEMFAEDQHHAHFLRFAEVNGVHDRDLEFLDADGEMIAYLAPYDEWPEVDASGFREARERWLSWVEDNRESFEQFCEQEKRSLTR